MKKPFDVDNFFRPTGWEVGSKIEKVVIYLMNLPDGWELRESEDFPGRVFYFNPTTHESTWIRPLPYPGCDFPWPPLICITRLVVKPATTSHSTSISPLDQARRAIDRIFIQITTDGRTLEDVAKDDPDSPVVIPPEWISRDSLPSEFDKVWQLAIGELSDPIDTDDGCFLVLRNG